MRILVIAMPGCGNLGDDLISEILQHHIIERYPNAELGIVCGESSSFNMVPNAINLFRPRKLPGKFLSREGELKKYAKTSDLIFIGGGGLFQDTHSDFTIHAYLHWIYYAKCPIICVGIGVGPIHRTWNKWYLKRTLDRDGVIIQLRDKESYEYLSQMEFNNIICSCDIVEGSELPLKKTKSLIKTLGCSIRQWNDIDVNKIVNVINKIIHDNGVRRVCFFAFEHTESSPLEYDFLVKIAEMINIETHVYAYGKDHDFMESLQSVDIAIASRYHANIIWQKIGVPVIPIAYAPKVYSLYLKKGIRLYPFCSDNFKKQLLNIAIDERYSLPVLTKLANVSFSSKDTFINSIIHFFSLVSSVIQSIRVMFCKR